jgi:hypothetical protein
VPTAQAIAIDHDAMSHQLREHAAGSAQNHNASTRRGQVGQISLFLVDDLLFATILMLPMLYSFTLPLPDQSADAISDVLEHTQRKAAMHGFHLRWSHANSTPAWSASEVGRLLSSCAIPIAEDSQQSKRHATRVERRIDLIKDQHLLQRSATSTITTTELITAANTQVNLRTDHVSQPGSSPTDRFVAGPTTYSHTTKLAPTPRHTQSPYRTQVLSETSDDNHDLRSRAQTVPVPRHTHLPTHVRREVDTTDNDDYPYWDRAADTDHYTSLQAPPPFETQAFSLDVPHVAEHQADMSGEDGEQPIAILFADDLLVTDAYVRHLAAILTNAMKSRRLGMTYE